MTANEDLLDKTRVRQFRLLRVDAGARNDANRELDKLGNDLAALAAAADFGQRRSVIIKRKNELFKEAREVTRETYTNLAKRHFKDMREMSGLEIDFVDVSTAAVIGILALPAKTVSSLEITKAINDSVIEGNTIRQWWTKTANMTNDAFYSAINEGASLKETGAALAQRIKGGIRQGAPIIGIMTKAKKNVGSVIRTGNQIVTNKVRLLAYKVNPNVNGITQISIFDSRTSNICVAYGGRKWDLNQRPIGHSLPWHNGPPRHFNCRSSTAPILDMDEDINDMTFDVWLKGKSDKFQNGLLGVGKADLWRKNTISLTDLVNPIGRPLTLADLKVNNK